LRRKRCRLTFLQKGRFRSKKYRPLLIAVIQMWTFSVRKKMKSKQLRLK
jgi:hypothetical protein